MILRPAARPSARRFRSSCESSVRERERECVCALVACADRVDDTTGEHDTEAEAEQEEDPDEGGLRTITFAGGKAHDIGAWMGV